MAAPTGQASAHPGHRSTAHLAGRRTSRWGIAERIAVPLVISSVAVGAFVLALDFTASAREIPLIISVPLIVLSGIVLAGELRALGRREDASPSASGVPALGDQEVTVRSQGLSQRAVFGVLAGLATSWLLLGFPVGAAVFLAVFLRFVSRCGWLATALITVATVLPLHLLLAELLNVSSYSGLLMP